MARFSEALNLKGKTLASNIHIYIEREERRGREIIYMVAVAAAWRPTYLSLYIYIYSEVYVSVQCAPFSVSDEQTAVFQRKCGETKFLSP